MYAQNALRTRLPAFQRITNRSLAEQSRAIHVDGRNRLSNFWVPTQNIKKDTALSEDGHDVLLRAGFLRQAHSGIFHLLPLGLRVQDKLERLIDKHMLNLGASKVSLSSLSSEKLWRQSGRLEGRDSEFLRLRDRKGAKYLLSPTHEEEITSIVGNAIKSYRELPLRLYQVTRKYRDEARPRQGLLRGREFLMKDLYTFDLTEEQARQTYEEVRSAYAAFFDELRLPYLVANADSGNMGGTLSHEYHLASTDGEDNVIGCRSCDYSINEELFVGRIGPQRAEVATTEAGVETSYGISKDRRRLFEFVIPTNTGSLNLHLLKKMFPDLDTGVEDPLRVWQTSNANSDHEDAINRVEVVDPRVHGDWPRRAHFENEEVYLTNPTEGDVCPQCQNPSLHISKAVEIGHTFHLATRYSEPLKAQVRDSTDSPKLLSMGCHGIGVSRLMGAAASLLADTKGLNWPLRIAPFSAVFITLAKTKTQEYDMTDPTVDLHDVLLHELGPHGFDFVIDDRDRAHGWKLYDADLVGYPFVVVVSKHLEVAGEVELQCRRLGVKEYVAPVDLAWRMYEYAQKL